MQFQSEEQRDFTFDAFICHSTRGDGARVATLRKEMQMRSRRFYGVRRLHLFQDRFDLGGGVDLWDKLQKNLSTSKHLIVILTPESRQSPGMKKEIEWWLENRSLDSILLVALSGQIHWDDVAGRFSEGSAVPEVLQTAYPAEPFFYDLSGYRGSAAGWPSLASIRDRMLGAWGTAGGHSEPYDFTTDTLLSLLAVLENKTLDEVRRDDLVRRRAEMLIGSVALVLISASTLVAINQHAAFSVERSNNEADRHAALSASFSEDDPGRAASQVLLAREVKETARVVSQTNRLAYRWPFLTGVWLTAARPDDALLNRDGTKLLVCNGKAYSIGDVSNPTRELLTGTLQVDAKPKYGVAACRGQPASPKGGPFISLNFVIRSDGDRAQGLPGPTVYKWEGDKLSLVRKGQTSDQPASVCKVAAAAGLYFSLNRKIWFCNGTAAEELTSQGFDVPVKGISPLHYSDNGGFLAFLEYSANAANAGARKSNIVMVSTKDGSRKAVATVVKAGAQIQSVSLDGREVEIKEYGGWRTVGLYGRRAGRSFLRSKQRQMEIDAFAFGQRRRTRWLIKSMPYTGTERDRSFVVYDARTGDYQFERFATTAAFARTTPARDLIIVARNGMVELYNLRPKKQYATVSTMPFRRFRVCQPIKDPAGRDASLLLDPAGGIYVHYARNQKLNRSISSRRHTLNIYRASASDKISDLLAGQPDAWIVKLLQARWSIARRLKVGLHDVKRSERADVHAAVVSAKSLGVRINGKYTSVPVPNGESFLKVRAGAFQISPTGKLIIVPTRNGAIAYDVDTSSATINFRGKLPGIFAAAFSNDGKQFAYGAGTKITVMPTQCLPKEGATSAECDVRENAETTFRAHANGVSQLAFDRQQPLLYGGGFDRRISIHHLGSGERLDLNMKVHTQPIESLCAPADGGVLSLDQSTAAIYWTPNSASIVDKLSRMTKFHWPTK